jgi:GNAT superfamily N-acetyltransferase
VIPDSPTDTLLGLAAVPPKVIQAAREIYEAGFPPAERAPFEDLLDVRSDERMQILLDGHASGGSVLGVVVVRDLGETRWSFLRYFVVAADRRGHGIGGRLWSALCRDLAVRGRQRVLFDVEDPDDATAAPHEVDERRRRVQFYRRAGADLIDVDSYAPPHHGAPGTPTMPLRPMGASLDAVGGSRRLELDAVAIEELVGAVMHFRYGVKTPDGPAAPPPDEDPA